MTRAFLIMVLWLGGWASASAHRLFEERPMALSLAAESGAAKLGSLSPAPPIKPPQ